MPTYISILRGINVSGHRVIKMDVLRQLFAELGFKNIQTYIQSGNIIFQSEKLNPGEIKITIQNKIKEFNGFDVPVIILTLNELQHIINNNPFVHDRSKDAAHLHVTFLSDTPDNKRLKKFISELCNPDEMLLNSKAIYLYCPNGYSKSKFTNTYLENKLKVKATTRNWKTTLELLHIAETNSGN